MKQHFAPVAPVVPVLRLSIEEEAILEDEMNLHSAELDGILEDSNRLGDIVVTMGDAQATVSNTPEIGTMEQELVAAVADMAVAGSDANPEDLEKDMLPPAEGLSAESILESAGEMIKKIWEGIKALMAKMWDHIKNFFMRIGEFITGTKRRIAKLEELVEANGATLKDRTIDAKDVYTGIKAELAVGNEATKAVGKDYSELVAWFKNAANGMVDASKHSMAGGTKVLEGFLRNPKLVDNNLKVFTHDLINPLEELGKSLGVTWVYGEDKAKESKDLIGSIYVWGWLPSEPFHDKHSYTAPTTLASLKQVTSSLSLRQNRAVADLTNGPKSVPLTNSIDEIKKALSAAQDYVKLVEGRGRLIAELGDENKKTRDALDKLVAEATTSEKLDADSKAVVKELLVINSKMSGMFTKALQDSFSTVNRTSNCVLDYCIQSCELKPLKQAA